MRNLIVTCLLAVASTALAQPRENEAYRIRIDNRRGGLIQVSLDGGRTYGSVGRVATPANTRIIGFPAASYAPQGTVAAVAVHGIRIKTGRFASGVGKSQMPLIFSIVPREFAHIPRGYGGHDPRSSGIMTDIPAGHSIFRNQAPYVGNAVYIEQDQALKPLPEDYTPVGGEVFVIACIRPARAPTEVELENKTGGKVTARYADGSSETIAEVVRPARGVGRYDGTTFTGVGAINTNHPGVITVSTAPVQPPGTTEGGAVETRGGFMVQPVRHAREQGETSPQVMVIGPTGDAERRLEGTPPLFLGNVSLSRYPDRPANSCRAQIRIDDGGWQDVPQLVGKIDDALARVTAIRLLFPAFDRDLIARDLAKGAANYAERAVKSGVKPVAGVVHLSPRKPVRGKRLVDYLIDGVPVYTSNCYPYAWEWDTKTVPNGFHSIRIETRPESGGEAKVETREVLVRN